MSQPERAPSSVYRVLAAVARAILSTMTIRRWERLEALPTSGPLIVICNHTSNYDALAVGDALLAAGRWPRYLGKSEIWKVPGLGWLARKCRQIPVERHSERAKDSLIHAAAALEEGGCVVIFPEGTITRDPEGWPMVARTGAARLALTTGVPVVPVATEGAAAFLGGRHLELKRLFSLRRRPIHLKVGDSIDLGDLMPAEGAAPSEERVSLASKRCTEALTQLCSEVRGEPVPELIWDPWREAYITRDE